MQYTLYSERFFSCSQPVSILVTLTSRQDVRQRGGDHSGEPEGHQQGPQCEACALLDQQASGMEEATCIIQSPEVLSHFQLVLGIVEDLQPSTSYKELKERLLQSYAESYQETGTGEEQDVCMPLSAEAAKGVAALPIY
jgi:hypothetical protein